VRLRQVGGEPDPHIWQDPRNAMVMATNIERGLARADPGSAGFYEANLAAYLEALRALDAEVERRTAGLANRKVVTNHDAIGYYLDRYHLELVGSVIPSFDSSAELSGRDVRDLALYGDSLGPPGSDGDSYIRMIRHNTRTIVSNLSGT
jgi:ABC-type Zn uptake system ZnuABC Zn-binding protein ZnuA